jgi:hypothetical protein
MDVEVGAAHRGVKSKEDEVTDGAAAGLAKKRVLCG